MIMIRDRSFNLQGGGLWFFVSFINFILDNTRVRISFFCRAKREIFFQNTTLGYMTNSLNQIIFFFLYQNQNIFFQQHWESEYFFQKQTVVLYTDCIDSCKSNFHTITTTTSPIRIRYGFRRNLQYTILLKLARDCQTFISSQQEIK